MWEQLLTDPFINSVVSGTLSGLAANFIPAAGRRLKETFSDKGKNAMERCLKNGLIAIAAAARDCSEAEKELLKDIFRNFFHNPSVNTQLIKLTIGKQPERDELYFLFEDAGYVRDNCPGWILNKPSVLLKSRSWRQQHRRKRYKALFRPERCKSC